MQEPHPTPRYKSIIINLIAISVVLYFVGTGLYFGMRWLGLLPTSPDATATTVSGQVVEIVEEGTVEVNGQQQPYQILQVQVLDGRWAGQVVTIDYGKTQLAPPGISVAVGDRIFVDFIQKADGSWQAYFLDFLRTPSMLWLVGLFVVFTILLSGWKGVRSLIAMLFSFIVIIGFILPRILAGDNPVVVSVVGSFVILATTLYIVYGWTLKTHAAVLGILIALSITSLLALFFSDVSHLTGFGSEEAMFLSQQFGTSIDLRGLVLSGMLIGALGVLDDLVITQTSAVFELYQTDIDLNFGNLYKRAMRIGQDHVAATVNTLVLAYTGAALPLLLLVTQAGEQFGTFINREFVAEEVVRTLVGSLSLMSAVPITTVLACLAVIHHDRLGQWLPYLGPLGGGGHHHH